MASEGKLISMRVGTICTLLILITSCKTTFTSEENVVPLSGTKWELVAWSEGSMDPVRFHITASFDKSSVSGKSAVNTYGGGVKSFGKEGLEFGELQSTLMGASEEYMRAEGVYFDLLRRTRKYSLGRGTLFLKDETGRIILTFKSIGS